MELILLERIAKRKTYTIGRLYIQRRVDDEYLAGTADDYFCDTLEPTWRDYEHGAYKVKGRSAIPEGRYAVVISWSTLVWCCSVSCWRPITFTVIGRWRTSVAFLVPVTTTSCSDSESAVCAPLRAAIMLNAVNTKIFFIYLLLSEFIP